MAKQKAAPKKITVKKAAPKKATVKKTAAKPVAKLKLKPASKTTASAAKKSTTMKMRQVGVPKTKPSVPPKPVPKKTKPISIRTRVKTARVGTEQTFDDLSYIRVDVARTSPDSVTQQPLLVTLPPTAIAPPPNAGPAIVGGQMIVLRHRLTNAELGFGTLGALVQDQTTGNTVALSCSHVFCGIPPENTNPNHTLHIRQRNGKEVLLGTQVRNGLLPIGSLSVDSTTAAINPMQPPHRERLINGFGEVRLLGSNEQDKLTTPQPVFKSGARTGQTQGVLSDTGFTQSIQYGLGGTVRRLNELFVIEDQPGGPHFARQGDSGSMVLAQWDGQYVAIGVIVAVDDVQNITYAANLHFVRSRVTI